MPMVCDSKGDDTVNSDWNRLHDLRTERRIGEPIAASCAAKLGYSATCLESLPELHPRADRNRLDYARGCRHYRPSGRVDI